MRSKNKPAQTANEREWVSALAQQGCVICGASPVEIHEFDQGLWFTAVPLCPPCHRGPHGWHGTRQRWTLRKMDMVKSINTAVARAWEAANV